MISSILAFAAGLAAKIKLQPDSNPETAGKSDLDLATLLIAARVEISGAIEGQAKAEHDHIEAMRVLNVTRELLAGARRARDAAKIEARDLRDRTHILERQRAQLAEHIAIILDRERAAQDRHAAEIQRLVAVMPINPSRLQALPEPMFHTPLERISGIGVQDAQLQAQSQFLPALLADSGHSHVGLYQQLPPDHEWWRSHPEAAFRYFDCTCVPARADAFRNQQAQARD
jgi:hypothetical protein